MWNWTSGHESSTGAVREQFNHPVLSMFLRDDSTRNERSALEKSNASCGLVETRRGSCIAHNFHISNEDFLKNHIDGFLKNQIVIFNI